MKEIGEARTIEEWVIHVRGKPIEEAELIHILLEKGYEYKDIVKLTSLSKPVISRRLTLLTLTPNLIRRVKDGDIRPRTAYYLSKLSEEEQVKYEEQKRVTLKEVEARVRENIISKEILDELETPFPVETKDYQEQMILEAIQTLSRENVQLDVGWSDDKRRYWRFLFGEHKKPLVCIFENGFVLVDIRAKMKKTRRNHFFEFSEEDLK